MTVQEQEDNSGIQVWSLQGEVALTAREAAELGLSPTHDVFFFFPAEHIREDSAPPVRPPPYAGPPRIVTYPASLNGAPEEGREHRAYHWSEGWSGTAPQWRPYAPPLIEVPPCEYRPVGEERP